MKTLLLSLLMFLAAGTLSAQEKTTLEILQAKTWVVQLLNPEEGRFVKIKFTTDEYTTISGIMGLQLEMKNPYYLSNESNWTFDEQKVGQTENGKYIIVNHDAKDLQNVNYNKVMIFEILKLTETELQLKNLSNNSILTYKCEETE